jgi:hypothetical protein
MGLVVTSERDLQRIEDLSKVAEGVHLDGILVTGTVAAKWFPAPDLSFVLDVPFAVENARAPHLDHRDLGLSIGVEKNWTNGLTTGSACPFRTIGIAALIRDSPMPATTLSAPPGSRRVMRGFNLDIIARFLGQCSTFQLEHSVSRLSQY